MKRFYTVALLAAVSAFAWAGEVTDVISSTTISIPEVYEEQEVSLTSDAVYLVTLKDDGNGPQFKAGSSGIVTKESGGNIKRVEVAWGSKSNENIEVYGQHTPYSASNTVIGGTLLGVIEFSAGSTVGIDIDGDWEYIGITTTTVKGKAAQFGSISLTWSSGEATPDEACDRVIINEVCGDDGSNDGNEDWIELYNPTTKALDLSGVKIQKTDEDGIQEIIYTITEGTTLAAGEYYVVEKGTHFKAGLSNNKNLTITLISPLEKRLSMFDKSSAFTHNGSHPTGGSYSYDVEKGAWVITSVATKGTDNVCYPEVQDLSAWYTPVTSVSQLIDGMHVIFVNTENEFVMSYQWDTTKDGGVYLYGYKSITAKDEDKIQVDTYNSATAVVKLVDGGDGTWALNFGDTNNYLNDSRFLACTVFKNMSFKKNDDPTKGTRAIITFNAGGDAEISYGEGGVIKFNLKSDTTSRFFNYDPEDKPEDHLAVTLYKLASESGIADLTSESVAAPVYYNMQGMQVQNPKAGDILIVKRGNSVQKVIIR